MKAWPAYGGGGGCCQHRWSLQLWGLEPGASGRLVYLDRMCGKNGGLAKLFLTPSLLPWWHCLEQRSEVDVYKMGPVCLPDPWSFSFLQSNLGKGCFPLSCNSSHGLVDGSVGCLVEFPWGRGQAVPISRWAEQSMWKTSATVPRGSLPPPAQLASPNQDVSFKIHPTSLQAPRKPPSRLIKQSVTGKTSTRSH